MKQQITKYIGTWIDIFDKPIEEVIIFLQDLQKQYPNSYFEKDSDGTIEHYWNREETDKEYESRLIKEKEMFESRKRNVPNEIKMLEGKIQNLKETYGL